MKKLLAILTILLITSCGGVWEKNPDEYPLTVISIYNDGNYPGYTHYTILDNDPVKNGWGADAMYIYLIDKENKFQIGDTVIFVKK